MSEKKKEQSPLRIDNVAGRNFLQFDFVRENFVIFLSTAGDSVTSGRELVEAKPTIVFQASLVRQKGLVLGEERN